MNNVFNIIESSIIIHIKVNPFHLPRIFFEGISKIIPKITFIVGMATIINPNAKSFFVIIDPYPIPSKNI